jgi:membrane protein
MSSDKSYLARVQSMPRYYFDGLVRELSTKNVFLFAQAIAFKVLVTIVPIVLLLMGVLGDILGQQEPFAMVSRFVRGFLPPYESEKLLDFLGAFQGSSGAFLSVGTISLAVMAITLATTVRVAVSSAFEQEWNEERTLMGGYAFDLRMVAQVGVLFLLTVALSFLVQALNAEGLELMQAWGLDQWLRAGWQGAFDVLSLGVPLLVSAAMFFQLFYFIPLPHPPKTSAGIGALITAVLWEAAKYGFAIYATSGLGTFDFQSGTDGMAVLTSSFGLLIAFVFWVYYSGIVLMVGAVIASLHEQRRRVRKKGGRSVAPGDKLDAAARQHVGETVDAPAEEEEGQSDSQEPSDGERAEDGAATPPNERAAATVPPDDSLPARTEHSENPEEPVEEEHVSVQNASPSVGPNGSPKPDVPPASSESSTEERAS